MAITDDLKTLSRQFPQARELAVSPAMLDEFLMGMTHSERFVPDAAPVSPPDPPEVFYGCAVQGTRYRFRNHWLSVVTGK